MIGRMLYITLFTFSHTHLQTNVSLKKTFIFLLFFSVENYMAGYRIVFDRENMKLGWSASKCKIWIINRTLVLIKTSTGSNLNYPVFFFLQVKRIR